VTGLARHVRIRRVPRRSVGGCVGIERPRRAAPLGRPRARTSGPSVLAVLAGMPMSPDEHVAAARAVASMASSAEPTTETRAPIWRERPRQELARVGLVVDDAMRKPAESAGTDVAATA